MQPVYFNQRLPGNRPNDQGMIPAARVSGQGNVKRKTASIAWLIVIVFAATSLGCASTQQRLIRASAIATESLVSVKKVRRTPRFSSLKRLAATIPKPSERTELLLRKFNLTQQYDQDPDAVIKWFQKLAQSRPTMEEIHGLAEIAEIQARWSEAGGDSMRATGLYATAVVHAYQFLFDSQLNIARNAYDPQFRSICDIYNRSLEGLLRKVIVEKELGQGKMILVGDRKQGIELEVQIDGRWRDQQFTRFELVSDYEASGIDNQYHTYGLGVPLIAVRQHQALRSDFEKYYPPEITIPMTAFMHLSTELATELTETNQPVNSELERQSSPKAKKVRRAILRLYDPLEQTMVKAESQMVPLESDITTPLAYGLRDPFVNKELLATASLLNAEFAPESYGLFMLEPYDPDKIPVVMVHGFWSSPVTWIHMFNDLRANRDIRENCQFWFYSYPTGQPFWISAQQMRSDLEKIRQDVDPLGDSTSLDQMVLVGHSMGGLMSIMQTIESGDEFWKIISEHPIDSLDGNPETIELLRETFFFRPNHAVDRVITLATPFRGSEFSNAATQWVSKKLFTLPNIVTKDFKELAKRNKDNLNSTSCLTTMTSIDSLAPGQPVLEAIASAQQAKSVKTHNIIGRLERKSIFKASSGAKRLDGDGVVSIESATNETAESRKFVPVEHSDIHQHPGAIFEVRRILLEHLAEHDRIRPREIPDIPVVRQATIPVQANGNSYATPERPVADESGGVILRR